MAFIKVWKCFSLYVEKAALNTGHGLADGTAKKKKKKKLVASIAYHTKFLAKFILSLYTDIWGETVPLFWRKYSRLMNDTRQ